MKTHAIFLHIIEAFRFTFFIIIIITFNFSLNFDISNL